MDAEQFGLEKWKYINTVHGFPPSIFATPITELSREALLGICAWLLHHNAKRWQAHSADAQFFDDFHKAATTTY